MEPENVIVPCKHPSDVESVKRNPTIRFTLNGVPTQQWCEKTSSAMICSKGVKHVENIGTSNKNGPSPISEKGLSNQNTEVGPSKQLIGLDKSNSNQTKQEEKKLATTANNASGNKGNQDDDSPKSKLAKLKKETHKLTRKIRKYSKRCVKLRDANEILLSELKEMCEPHVFEELRRKNPSLPS